MIDLTRFVIRYQLKDNRSHHCNKNKYWSFNLKRKIPTNNCISNEYIGKIQKHHFDYRTYITCLLQNELFHKVQDFKKAWENFLNLDQELFFISFPKPQSLLWLSFPIVRPHEIKESTIIYRYYDQIDHLLMLAN
jgi:hypothetical protein